MTHPTHLARPFELQQPLKDAAIPQQKNATKEKSPIREKKERSNAIFDSLGVDNATIRTVTRDCHSYRSLHYRIQRFYRAFDFPLQHGGHIIQRHESVFLLLTNTIQAVEIVHR